jgi:hypothetical protein
MCCETKWTKNIPLAVPSVFIQCIDGPGPTEATITVTVQAPNVLVSIKWYKWNGSAWIATGDTTLSITVADTTDDYRALVITEDGSAMMDLSLPCLSSGEWEYPDGIEWEFPDGGTWEFPWF